MKKRLGITGVTGLVGGHLKSAASAAGWDVVGYSRKGGQGETRGLRRMVVGEALDVSGLDVMVNLAGESILGYWTEAKKRRILESRVLATRQVVDAMLKDTTGPKVLVNASAIGYYGDTGETEVDETSALGTGFLAEVTEAWETEARRAAESGIRVVCVRLGMVLSKDGGAAKLMRPAFKLGLGGRLGDGKQWMSPVHVEDVAGLMLEAAADERYQGAVNAVLPEPCRNVEFTQALGRVLRRPVIFPVPAFVLKLILGEMRTLLLASSRVKPTAALEQGYAFRYPTLSDALRDAFD